MVGPATDKFGKNPAISLGGDTCPLKQLLTTDNNARLTTDDRHPIITIAHHEPMAKVS